jgi:hypothetical protein
MSKNLQLLICVAAVLIAALWPMWVFANSRDWDETRNSMIAAPGVAAVLAVLKMWFSHLDKNS